ncbi:MAG: diphthamide synthesis protein [Candidatus Woesearchaeota archaeon]
MEYDLELERVAQMITDEKARSVCIQLPDGLKPHAGNISDELEKTGAEIFIWFGSCFGACDVPSLDVDFLIQWGHSPW